jgi:electron transfer flavoprotein beta subunit
LKIVVCIKQVPDTADVKINPETNTLIREGVPSIINPFDLNAIEAGLQIRNEVGGEVVALTMGPPQAEDALREAVSLGVDSVILLSDRAFAGADTWATAFALAGAIKKMDADIILCGKQAIDGDTAQVGPEIAQFMDVPHIAYIRKVEEVKDGYIKVQRLMDEGYDVVESSLPVLLTTVKELNIPRMPSLKGKMAAKKAEIKTMNREDIGIEEADLGLKGSPTQVKGIFAPEIKTDRRMFEGTAEEQVNALVEEMLRSKCL